jgi:hypothetical protein
MTAPARASSNCKSSEILLHKDYDRMCSVEKKTTGREPKGACRQDELIGNKSPVVK